MVVTAAYWAFTLSDGALRMLVIFHFHGLGYSTLDIALLFIFYEFFGVLTNLAGGWIGARYGLRLTLWSGLLLQVVALLMLVPVAENWPKLLSVIYVMAAQALSGIAKDLSKMSAKSAITTVVPVEAGQEQQGEYTLFRWVAILTGSKNALKGVGFFLGGATLFWLGFAGSVSAMAVGLAADPVPAGGHGQDEAETGFRGHVLQIPRHQRAVVGPLFPIRRPGRVVCGGPAGVPGDDHGLELLAGGGFHGAVGGGLRPGVCHEFVHPLLHGAGLHESGGREPQRGFLLHGQCR